MNPKNKTPLLLSPGPTPACPSVLKTLSKPIIHHRTPAFTEQIKQTQRTLKKVFQTEQTVLILNASGTGAMSAALLNTLSPGDEVLVFSAGKFGERWIEMAESYGLKTHILTAPWGKAVKAEKVHQALQKNLNIKAVLGQACETSTGVLHPVKELAEVCAKTSALFILDAISALGAVDIQMDKWKIDALIGGSQKAFGLPAGMSFIALSEKAWEFNKRSKLPVYYFDLKKEKQAQEKGQTAFSSNTSFVRALNQALAPVEQQGLSIFIQNSRCLSEITLEFCRILGLQVYADPPAPCLTSIALPKGMDGVQLKKLMESKHNILLGGGQGKLKGSIIRVSHLGNISAPELIQSLKALTFCLKDMNPHLKLAFKKSLDFLSHTI